MFSDHLNIVKNALKEDLGFAGDVTCRACVPDGHRSQAKIIARQAGVIAGMEYFTSVFHEIDPSTIVEVKKYDGDRVLHNEIIALVEGNTASLLSAERTALNFLGHLSGIATMTAKLAEKIAGTGVILLDTRKTLPGLRIPEKKAVRAGGGYNHRCGLFDMILIKENHITAAGSIEKALKSALEFNKTVGNRLEIEIEVRNLKELKQALKWSPDRIMLDNFTPEEVKKAGEIAAGQVPIEISGGVNEGNIRKFAEAGPDYISVGSITLAAPALDISMLMEGIQ